MTMIVSMLQNFKLSRYLALCSSCLLFACAVSSSQNLVQSAPIALADFTTDGCSLFPDGTPAQPKLWCHCCVEHDKAYWAGGTESERSDADLALKVCVQTLGRTKTAEIIWLGVRVGGSPYLPTSFRWSYGWPYMRGYRALNLTELAVAQEKWLQYSQPKSDKNSGKEAAETEPSICALPLPAIKE